VYGTGVTPCAGGFDAGTGAPQVVQKPVFEVSGLPHFVQKLAKAFSCRSLVDSEAAQAARNALSLRQPHSAVNRRFGSPQTMDIADASHPRGDVPLYS
jgi:hypothetical protein